MPVLLTVGSNQFSRNYRYRVINKKDKIETWNFEIRKVRPEDQGLYECFVKLGSKHKVKVNFNLIVKNEQGIFIYLF